MVTKIPLNASSETWRMFRVISEFVNGIETLANIGPCVSVFGSARTEPDDKYFKMAVEIGKLCAQNNYGVITGGGPGIMEAAHIGAAEANGKAIGLNIKLPMEQHPNKYQNIQLDFHYFFVRKVMFLRFCSAVVVFPGGFGTLDEAFEVLTLIQTEKTQKIPLILIGKDFWQGMMDWIEKAMLVENKYISPEDPDLLYLTDDPNEALDIINEFNKNRKNAINF
ncbi:MAG: TIGR00730 family Rossman fold protein [Chitinivibrionia bacterium]|nr:TIGR00730 family Rossman fold protein [Chitinivibrionia bacterium]